MHEFPAFALAKLAHGCRSLRDVERVRLGRPAGRPAPAIPAASYCGANRFAALGGSAMHRVARRDLEALVFVAIATAPPLIKRKLKSKMLEERRRGANNGAVDLRPGRQ